MAELRRRAARAAVVTALVVAGCAADSPASQPTASPPPPAAVPATSEPQAPSPPPAAPSSEPAGSEAAGPRLENAAVELETVARLDAPTAMIAAPGGDGLWVTERSGTVRRLTGGAVADDPVLDISDQTTVDGERGLLGLALSADGEELFVSYTDLDGNSRVDAYPVDGAGVDGDSPRSLLRVEQPYANHNGGMVAVGPDEMLYVGLGDGGAAGDPQGNGQDPSTLLGSLLRVDPRPDGDEPYAVPADNPFAGDDEGRDEIWAYGLRNPWRFSFDRETGDLWIADVGQDALEEINFAAAGAGAGANYGWARREGTQPFEGGEHPDGNVDPVAEYGRDRGCSIIGGYVYRGQALEALRGAYVYTDLCAGDLRALALSDGSVDQEADLGVTVEQPVAFGEDADGELYVLSLEGDVHRLVSG